MGDLDSTTIIAPEIREIMNFLQNQLNEVNLLRRNEMNTMSQSINIFREMQAQMYNNIDRIQPAITDSAYAVYQHSLNVINNILENLENSTEAAFDRYALTIGPLDLLASELEKLLQGLDPNYELESDTDSEKIREAASEVARRARIGTMNGSGPGADSGSGSGSASGSGPGAGAGAGGGSTNVNV